MGEMKVKIDEGLLLKLEDLAQSHNISVEEQVNDILRDALTGKVEKQSFAANARRIADMTPKNIVQPDSLQMLREDRNR